MKPGKYVVAVSGGVDSVVLLDLLVKTKDLQVVVAHFDHGIREISGADRKFVEDLAKAYGLEFFYEEGNLGPEASEALAREKRYEFLEKVRDKTQADAIVTAHHEDDIIETIAINILRGTGRKGLASLASGKVLTRPLLKFSKSEIIDYARQHGLKWREDETNADEKYPRNYVRRVFRELPGKDKQDLLRIYRQARERNEEIDMLAAGLLGENREIPRRLFNSLDHKVACELMAVWLRKEHVPFDKNTVDKLAVKLKTAKEGKVIQVARGRNFRVESGVIRMNHATSV
jgi:tRNA(Ile)-lysidine synthase